MPVSDQRRSLTPPTRDSAASRNAAADVIVGNLTLFTPEQKSKILRQKKLSRNLFPLNYNQNPSPIRTAQGTNSQTSANLNSAAVRAEKRLRQSRYADGRRLPKPRFSQSHKLAIPHPQTKPLKLKIQPSTLKFRRTSGSNTTVLGRNIIRCITSVTTLATSRQRIVKFLD